MNVVKLKKKLTRFATKVTQKFRRGDHEKGFIGAGAGAVLIAIGASSYLGNTINSMVGSLTGGGAGGLASFVNDVVLLIGIISVILGIVEYRKLRKQIFK
ncbi:hypothetical protein SULI_07940 [Saccharolobus solfataricus]|uniref:Uncharacterized protein n=2 Tax=Saccharolobus solfataricus TaxID=2287 RepID=A0A0E3MG48_SACSO|nr:hypothetical protein [Saccharolobus solfataricus]AKA73846.1 hypothetical protein SULB_1588 [Saccharolobus solfataricus]AKA76544.1 hypothetical protein SULC_1586 [Saccharolobus solfataricus]AKA79237.1 hypothetical protein SULA_1587 [Saccharolobus solfataricus]AZF68326.1 hypothetical protein SULG_07940 [Saccharolobus solfataricus]AZF70946.1 hypothetical protein SULH_07940 [Saccharolobus solfataricus]